MSFWKALRLDFLMNNADDEWIYDEEPHVSRRQRILQKYPEIKKLMGYDPWIALVITIEVLIQFAIGVMISWYSDEMSWFKIFLLAYFVGAFFNHSLGSAIHEVGHNLAFGHRYGWANRVLSLWCNVPLAIPFAISYKKYHADHHRWLGHEDNDVDIPTRLESVLFRHPITKMIWLFFHPAIHAFRPFFKSPKPVTPWEAINIVTQCFTDLLIFQFLGFKPFAYYFLSTFLGLGLHVLSGHFISEHYLFANNQATHSYYGPLNIVLFNVGYHVEHHDFPYIPYRKLPLVRKIAHEFYDDLPYHSSWIKVVWDFIWQDHMGPHARSITQENLSKPHVYSEVEVNGKKDK